MKLDIFWIGLLWTNFLLLWSQFCPCKFWQHERLSFPSFDRVTVLHSTYVLLYLGILIKYQIHGLAVISYYTSIMDFLNSWPINYDLRSYVMITGLGYLDIHVFPTKLAIEYALLSLYCAISNHSVAGSIILSGKSHFHCSRELSEFCLNRLYYVSRKGSKNI